MQRPRFLPSNSRLLTILPLAMLAFLSATQAGAGNPNLAKYPLRVHVLASDESHRTPRMSPFESVVCDSIGGMLDSVSPNPGGPISISGVSADPCSLHPESIGGRLLDIQNNDMVYSGEGRGDLVSPPNSTQGFTFQYDDCERVRVHPGFESLPARWKKPGKRLEVLIPSDDIPTNGRPLPPVKCSLTVTLHNFVYLLLRDGKLLEISQEDYWKRPVLRDFLAGETPTVQPRPQQQFTVPAYPPH
jgi:hypothetical protein